MLIQSVPLSARGEAFGLVRLGAVFSPAHAGGWHIDDAHGIP